MSLKVLIKSHNLYQPTMILSPSQFLLWKNMPLSLQLMISLYCFCFLKIKKKILPAQKWCLGNCLHLCILATVLVSSQIYYKVKWRLADWCFFFFFTNCAHLNVYFKNWPWYSIPPALGDLGTSICDLPRSHSAQRLQYEKLRYFVLRNVF